jgi:hypothetical protein
LGGVEVHPAATTWAKVANTGASQGKSFMFMVVSGKEEASASMEVNVWGHVWPWGYV